VLVSIVVVLVSVVAVAVNDVYEADVKTGKVIFSNEFHRGKQVIGFGGQKCFNKCFVLLSK